MVGDSETDVESARRAELRFVGVSYGFRDRAFLFGIGAALVIDRFGELPSLLDFDACEKTPTK